MKICLITLLLLPVLALGAEIDLGRKRVVAIDVGHTRASPGAISATGHPEYEFNLRVAKLVETKLKTTGTIEPVVISSEKSRTLPERTRIAAERNADLFVSIHHDSAQDKYVEELERDRAEQKFAERFSGYSVFVSYKNPQFEESLKLARRIGIAMTANGFKFAKHHAEAIRGENRPIIDPNAGVYAFDDLVVLKTATMPAVLVECGVIVNPKDEQALLDEKCQASIADAIVRGIREYFAHAPLTPRVEPYVPSETSSPAPTRYPKPGTTVSPRTSRDN